MQFTVDPNPRGSDLTERERQVLQLVANGLTNYQIAHEMLISEATVRFHVGNILSKLEVGNRTEAVRVALKHRLVD
jgi:NarL family two-component system response regulator LiaR